MLDHTHPKKRLGLFDPFEYLGHTVVLLALQLLFVDADLRPQRQARGRQHRVGHAAPFLGANLQPLQLDPEDFEIALKRLARVFLKIVAYVEKDIPVAKPRAWINGNCLASRSPMSVRHMGEFGTVKRFKRR